MTIPSSEGFRMEDSCLPCTPEEEREIVADLIRKSEDNEREGDLYYLISCRWWRDWEQYVGFDLVTSLKEGSREGILKMKCRPGPINNSELIEDANNAESSELHLQRDLQENENYKLVPEDAWKKLFGWYKGGPQISRKLTSHSSGVKKFVEVYPLRLYLVDARNTSERIVSLSRMDTVRNLHNTACNLLNLDPGKVQLWDVYFPNTKRPLPNPDQTLEDANLQMDQAILVEIQSDCSTHSFLDMDTTGNKLAMILHESMSPISLDGGPSFSNCDSSGVSSGYIHMNGFSSTFGNVDDIDDPLNNESKPDDRGLTGLYNLGNTCFMNSAIQCLVHTPPLVDFFLRDYNAEINKDNPLGMHGELAVAFGDLLRKLWSSGSTSVQPRIFKGKLARFAPQFSGYNQHDSQELLAFLLDGLHEDLNRVISKPYIEAPDANGRPDEKFANECWENHKARNDSIIVDKCQGQYKSTLVCPICSKISVTFDPFMYLSLPLPSVLTRKMTVTVFSSGGSSLPTPYTVIVPKNGHFEDLLLALSSECCLSNSEALLFAEVYVNKIHQYFKSSDSLSGVLDNDILVAYRLPANHEELLKLVILHHTFDRMRSAFCSNHDFNLIGAPLIICVSKESLTREVACDAVRTVLAPFVRKKSDFSPNLIKIEENVHNSSSDGNFMAVTDIGSSENHQSNSHCESQDMDNSLLSIHPGDDGGLSSQPTSRKVYFDWTEREHRLYDFSYLDKLPKVSMTEHQVEQAQQEAVSLYPCLDAFLKEEPLGPNDMWYCPNCKGHRQATKKLDLWRLPEILVVHLKRFSYSRYMKNKLDTFVNFPVHCFDLSKHVNQTDLSTESPVYELYAVINHYGGLGGGHYTAYCKLVEENRWYHFDDSHVSSVSEDSIQTSAAYVLFYQRSETSMMDESD